MEKIYKIQLNDSSVDKIHIPANCNQLQISCQFPENSREDYRYCTANKLYLFLEFFNSLRKAKIEILDMRHCENVLTLSDSPIDGLFRDLLHLKIVLFPKSLKELPHFKNCHNLSYVSAEGLELIPPNCFVNCPNLTDIRWGDNLKHIQSQALAGTGITHITLPNNKILIYDHAFQYCNNLCSIVLPNDIEELKDYVFADCANLVKIDGGKNIKKIDRTTFKGCIKLKYLSFRPSFIDGSFFKLNNYSYSRSEEDSYSIGRGIILNKINNHAIIWDIEGHRFYCGETDGLVNELIDFQIVDDVEISYIEEYMILDRTYKVINVNIIENVADKSFWVPDNIKESMAYYQKKLFEFSSPFRTFIDKTIDYVNHLDIDKIINEYKTTISERIRTKVGGDDSYYRHTVRKTSIQDSYINKILPPSDEEDSESGYCTFSYMSTKEKLLIEEADDKTRQNAREQYNKENHIDDIIDDYVQGLINANISIEKNIHLRKAKYLLKTLLDRPVLLLNDAGLLYGLKDKVGIYKPDVLTEELNRML